MRGRVIVTCLAILFGMILWKVGMILPWLFGPILAAVITSKFTAQKIDWPPILGTIGLFFLGAQIGVSFTRRVVEDIQQDLFNIILMNIFVIGFAVLFSFVFRWLVKCTFETALLSSIPGALSQMIVMAEENKQADLLVVTLSQTSRILFVVMVVPFIASLHQGRVTDHLSPTASVFAVLSAWQIILIVICSLAVYLLMKRIKFPVPQLLAPIAVIIVWNLSTGLNFAVPYPLIAVAQVLFGIRIGLQIYDLSSQLSVKLFSGIVIQNTVLLLATFVLSVLFSFTTHHSFNDLFLSAAPGGMAQIIIVGLETKANVAMISSYHIFRIFFILLVITPLTQWMLNQRMIDKI